MLIPKPLRPETYSYYTVLSKDDFIRKLQRATAPKPLLIRDSGLEGILYGNANSFRLVLKYRNREMPIDMVPVYIIGTYEELENKIKIHGSINVKSGFWYVIAALLFISLMIGVVNLVFYSMFGRYSEASLLMAGNIIMIFPIVIFLPIWLEKQRLMKVFIREFSLHNL